MNRIEAWTEESSEMKKKAWAGMGIFLFLVLTVLAVPRNITFSMTLTESGGSTADAVFEFREYLFREPAGSVRIGDTVWFVDEDGRMNADGYTGKIMTSPDGEEIQIRLYTASEYAFVGGEGSQYEWTETEQIAYYKGNLTETEDIKE